MVSPVVAEFMAWRSEQLPPSTHMPPTSSVRVTVHVSGTVAAAGVAIRTNVVATATSRRDMAPWSLPPGPASVSAWSCSGLRGELGDELLDAVVMLVVQVLGDPREQRV